MAQRDSITGRVHQLEDVTVVKAARKRTVNSSAPLQMIDRHDMLTMGVTDVADALHRMPGITLRDYGGAGGMKTVAVRGFGAKHTGVSYDGVMLSECQSGEIDLSRYSLDNVQDLTLTIGDNDDIFLSARNVTTPAVLNIRTLAMPSADLLPHLTAQMKVGSFGLVSPFVRYEQNISERFALSVVGEYTYADNDYPYTIQNVTITQHQRRTNSRMNTGHGEVNFAWRSSAASSLTGKVYYYDNDRQLPGQARYYTDINGETLHDRNAFAQLAYQSRLGGQWSVKGHAKYNWNESVYRDELMPGGINDASYWQREAYASAAVLFVPQDQWAFDYSADYAFNNLNGSSARAIINSPYRHTVLQSFTARYRTRRFTAMVRLLHSLYLNGQKTHKTSSQLKQDNSARNMRRLSPSVSLAWRLLRDRELYLRAGYKNIFRSPTFNESYYYHYGSTDLAPESTDQWNVGATWNNQWNRQTEVQLTLDTYYNQVKDMIVAVPYNMFVWTCINVGKVRSIGIDATLRLEHRFDRRHKVVANGSYSLQKVQNRSNPESPNYNKQIAYMPEHTGSGSLAYENPWVNLSIHGTGMTTRWPNNEHHPTTMLDGYTEFGVTAYRTFRWKRNQVDMRFDVKNLFNRQYSIVALYPMPGRSWQMTINYHI